MTNEYKFEEGRHIHTLDGKPLMGVTTVLSVISKPALIQWSANMACDYIKDKWGTNGLTKEQLLEVIEEARLAHRKKKEKAGDWGTAVHLAIEEWIKFKKEEPELDEMGLKVFNQFRAWAEENSVKFLESEKHVWSKALWIGGICDLVIEMNGKKYLADIKTSSGIYQEAFYQMGAYALCLEDMGQGENIEGYLVINLKKDGKMDTKLDDDTVINKDAFRFALGLYKIINLKK